MFDQEAPESQDNFNPVDEKAMRDTQDMRAAAAQRLQQHAEGKAGIINTGTGLIGAIIGGVAAGNPMLGYQMGKSLGVGDVIAHTGKGIKMPGFDQLKSLIGTPKPTDAALPAAEGATDLVTGAMAA